MSATGGVSRQRLQFMRRMQRVQLRSRAALLERRLARLRSVNRDCTDSLLGDADVAVSLTTHGKRLQDVFYAVESIGRGRLRPASITLWLDDGSPPTADLPPELGRLQRRGLTVARSENFGPHTKYFPYVETIAHHIRPLVTADDDIIYPPGWLQGLVRAAGTAAPEDRIVVCHRARRVRLRGAALAPYADWDFVVGSEPSVLNLATGVGGVLYAPGLLDALHAAGRGFVGKCDKADDLWLHVVELRNGYRVRQVRTMATHASVVPFGKDVALWADNVTEGGNDLAMAATYAASEVAMLLAAARTSAR